MFGRGNRHLRPVGESAGLRGADCQRLRLIRGAGLLLAVGGELGDFDGSGRISLDDLAEWDVCMTGPGKGGLVACCSLFDFDSDQDVDHRDFARFQLAFTGE